MPKGPGGVPIICGANMEKVSRAYVFVDGQNLFHGAKEAFGYNFPNYDVLKLAKAVCDDKGWHLEKIFFNTGVPNREDNAFWNGFWTRKLLAISRQSIEVYSRPLKYREKAIKLPDGSFVSGCVGIEKGIDVRIAIDIVKYALDGLYDVCLIFSQDQDLTEAVEEVKKIAQRQGRFVIIASAYPYSLASINMRGIDKTDWIRIEKEQFDACIDPYDYRPEG